MGSRFNLPVHFDRAVNRHGREDMVNTEKIKAVMQRWRLKEKDRFTKETRKSTANLKNPFQEQINEAKRYTYKATILIALSIVLTVANVILFIERMKLFL